MEHIEFSQVLHEDVLNDDEIFMSEDGYSFVNGHSRGKFLVVYWTFANEWCNNKHQFIAKTYENAMKRYKRETKRTPIEY